MATTINSNNTDGVVITPDTSGEIELQSNGVTKAKITANGLQDNNGNSLRGGSFRNFIINGDMNISQRGTSFTSINGYTLDRFRLADNNDGAVTVTQDTDVPSGQGFANSLKIDVTTADTSIGASQFAFLQHRIEGQNLQHLKYGTSSAEKITLSFWVKSNKTGTYCISVIKFAGDGTRYDYVEEYTISSASTWEKKTITISPDSNIQSSSGAIKNDNTAGLYVQWTLADGSSRHGTNEIWNTSLPSTSTSNQVNFMDNTSNELYLTGLQLEVGEGASDFEHLPYDVQLQRCQRYYQVHDQSVNAYYSAGIVGFPFNTVMRASPTLTLSYSGTANRVYRLDTGATADISISGSTMTTTGFNHLYAFTPSGWASAAGVGFRSTFVFSAEL